MLVKCNRPDCMNLFENNRKTKKYCSYKCKRIMEKRMYVASKIFMRIVLKESSFTEKLIKEIFDE